VEIREFYRVEDCDRAPAACLNAVDRARMDVTQIARRSKHLRYLAYMQTMTVEIPADLVAAAGFGNHELSAEATPLLALDREDRVSLGRARNCAGCPLNNSSSLRPPQCAYALRLGGAGRRSENPRAARIVTVVSDASPLIALARFGDPFQPPR
jgi:hypothetical protein